MTTETTNKPYECPICGHYVRDGGKCPQTHPNKWYLQWRNSPEYQIDFSAEKLMKMMRPEVEKILRLHGFVSPPSQSWRALRVREKLEKVIQDLVKKKDISGFSAVSKQDRLLKDFLAVSRTVWILEGRPI